VAKLKARVLALEDAVAFRDARLRTVREGACGNTSRIAKVRRTPTLHHWRGQSTIGAAVPSVIHRGDRWQRPDRSAKTLFGSTDRRFFPDTRVTAFRLAA
jgi:hypothetical protein